MEICNENVEGAAEGLGKVILQYHLFMSHFLIINFVVLNFEDSRCLKFWVKIFDGTIRFLSFSLYSELDFLLLKRTAYELLKSYSWLRIRIDSPVIKRFSIVSKLIDKINDEKPFSLSKFCQDSNCKIFAKTSICAGKSDVFYKNFPSLSKWSKFYA